MSANRAFGDADIAPDDFASLSRRAISAGAAAKATEQLEPVPPARSTAPMDLAAVIGIQAAQEILQSGKIVFHTVGDTGGVHTPQFQIAVANAMAADLASGACFWYHLGDVVYYYGQDQDYFAQFYDPYRGYNAPILAIPGNHDGVLFAGETATSLQGFLANFCTAEPQSSKDGQGAARTTMDQPGVYFTLNAPFVKFIGLYTNTAEGAAQGVIAAPQIGDAQLTFLKEQLAAAKTERASGQGRALILATHHPPFTGSPFHVPSPDMLQQLDQTCAEVGIWPDCHLSGHSHLYERYTRTINGRQIPYVVAGMGGYYDLAGLRLGKKPTIPQIPATGTDASGNPLRWDAYNDNTFGFMRMTVSPASITGEFITVDTASGASGVGDGFVLDLHAGTVSEGPPQP